MAVAYFYSSTAGEYTLTGGISSSATSVTVNSVTGLPSTPFKVALDPGLPQEEIVKVTNVAGTTLTVVRGWDGSSAVSHAALAKVRHTMSAEDLRLSREHENATASVHGVGTVVGTSEAQTLTNKNLTSGTNSFPSSLATTAALGAHTSATAAHGVVEVVGTTATQALTNKNLTSATNTFPGTLATTAALNAHTGSSAAHGVVEVVGTTSTQTLSNKTLASPALTGTPTVNSVAIPKIASGSVVITIPSGESNKVVSVDLTSYGFSTIPKVIVSTGVSTHFGHSGTISTTSAQIGATHRDNVTTGGSVNTYWIAVGS